MQDPHISHIVGDFESCKCVFLPESLFHKFSTHFFLPISYCVKLFVPLDMPHTLFSLSSKEEIYHLQFLPTKILSSAFPRATPKLFCDRTVIHFWPLPPGGDSEVSVYKSQWCFLFFIFSLFPTLPPTSLSPFFLSLFFYFYSYFPSFLCLSFPLSTIKKCVTGC